MSEARTQSFVGEIKKCPNCGAVLPSMAVKCPECGCKLRNVATARSMQKFYEDLQNGDDKQDIETISNYPVPNAKEDFIEFLTMAIGEIKKKNTDDRISLLKREAWVSKFEQMKAKAPLLFSSDPAFLEQLNKIFESTKTNRMKASTQLLIGAFVFFVIWGIFVAVFGSGEV